MQPAMLYGMETVLQTKRQERKKEEMEMRMQQFAQGPTQKDKM